MNDNILITGAAGFIGYHLCKRLLEDGKSVSGIDNLNDYYDVKLKQDRLSQLKQHNNFRFHKFDLTDRENIAKVFENGFDTVVNLAAQAGVRYSLINPYSYVDTNITGFLNILEGCKNTGVKHLVFASSSSVYGANTNMPFSVTQNVDHPVSLYAATKKSNELMAHVYSSLYSLPTTGLRFFTVYGPWGRPDMALFLFTKAIIEGNPIKVFNYGDMNRDFTYIDDIVEGVIRVMGKIPEPSPDWSGENPDPSVSYAPYTLYNIGNNQPIKLLDFIEIIEELLNKKAIKELLPIQPGDVSSTYANIDALTQSFDFRPKTPIREGIKNFIDWYANYYDVSL
ncbi:NAD-dependent epimerase [Candidatus Magnetomonas plexicatena]|uniref:NAD-dependent epimerase n=1 Tax=Candidatus Magnetomonas plexicatena TaxID=2552947 RepID=UPI001104E4CE|nr:NAD-dependent epimerase [Nitrospirales bacterium LBB_01]